MAGTGGSRISAEALVAEDPRLTPEQASRIASLLDERGAAATGDDEPPHEHVAEVTDAEAGYETPQGFDLETVMRRILNQVVAVVPGAVGASIRLDTGTEVRLGDADRIALELPFAFESRLQGALAVSVPAGLELSPEARRRLEDIAAFTATSLGAAKSITETVGSVLATQGLESPSSRLVSSVLGPSLDRHVRRAVTIERVRSVLPHVHAAFQPIVDLATREIVGFEALCRFPPGGRRTVSEWFADATDAGVGAELELAAVQAALASRDRLADGQFLAINVSPAFAVTPAFLEAIDMVREPSCLVIELTEHAPVDDYRQLVAALRALRGAGVRVAIDDAGAGFASLRHVLRLSPDLIKLDISLVRRIDADPVRRALATSLITFASEVGAVIVAEGIETRFELDTLVELGVACGQGFHLGRPGPLPNAGG